MIRQRTKGDLMVIKLKDLEGSFFQILLCPFVFIDKDIFHGIGKAPLVSEFSDLT